MHDLPYQGHCPPLNPVGPSHAMQYHQFTITLPEQYKSALAEMLHKHGSLGLYEQGDTVTAYFPDSVEPKIILKELELMGALLQSLDIPRSLTFDHSLLPDQDWNGSWKQSFKPINVGMRFTILPPWEEQSGDRIPLFIDPGMAFGTGHHETTRSCLVLMERYAAFVRRERFLDVGTGTGLLAIAACKLGFTTAIGIDTDPLSMDAARKNIELNGSEGIELIEGDISSAAGTYDMIAANLISETLIALSGEISARLEQSGVAILSGILKGQDEDVATAAAKAGLHPVERVRDGKWVTIACRH